MSFVKATRIVFRPCEFLGIFLVNLQNPRKDLHTKMLLFCKFNGISLMVVTECFFFWTLFNYPIVTLKDLVQYGHYLTYMFSTWSLFSITICRSQALKALFKNFYDLSENSFYSETNYQPVSVFCKFLTFLAFLMQMEQIYTMYNNLPNIVLYPCLSIFIYVWINIVHTYFFLIINTYIFLLSLYFSKINQFLNNTFINRQFLRTLIDMYAKNCQLADNLISISDTFLLSVLLCDFFWIMCYVYSKVYILVEIGFIPINEILHLMINIFLSLFYIGVLLWICSKTKNTVSFHSIL